MKKLKGLLVTMMVLTILVGSLGWIETSLITNEGGMVTTLEEPDPVRD